MTKKKSKANGKDTAEPPRMQVKCERFLKVTFTEADLRTKASELARENTLVGEIDLQRKSAMSQFKDRRATCEQKISTLSREISNGYEFRTVECFARYHDPKSNQKTIYRLDTNEAVAVEPMTADERQELLPFAGETTTESKPEKKSKKAAIASETETKPEQATEAPF